MTTLIIKELETKYFESYFITYNSLVKENKYLITDKLYTFEQTKAFLNQCLKQRNPFFLLIDQEIDQCVGWADLGFIDDKKAYLGIGILKAYRNLKQGQLLIEKILNKAKDIGLDTIYLEVLASNKRAIHVYEKMGFMQLNNENNEFIYHSKKHSKEVLKMKINL